MDDPVVPEGKHIRRESGGDQAQREGGRTEHGRADRQRRPANHVGRDRTLLAAERTYAAWVRTALAALAAGIGARALVKDILPAWVGKLTGTVLIVFAGFCLLAAVWRELQGVPPAPHPDIRPIPRAILVPMNFILLLVAIAALVGIWSA